MSGWHGFDFFQRSDELSRFARIRICLGTDVFSFEGFRESVATPSNALQLPLAAPFAL